MDTPPNHNERTHVWRQRMESAVWVLIYGGLLTIVLGLFVQRTQSQDATELYWGGGIAVFAGLVLIYLRSRIGDDT